MKVELLHSSEDLEKNIAIAARICYGKEDNTKNTDKLIKALKRDGHLATFRFGHITFQISEMSRNCSMQMLRHAFLDFLQRSQRYVKEFKFNYVLPPSIASNKKAKYIYTMAMEADQEHYNALLDCGIRAEDARYVLSGAVHTKMNVTGNVQAWYDFLYGNAGRLQKAAQWEIKEFAQEIERQLKLVAPNIFKGVDDATS